MPHLLTPSRSVRRVCLILYWLAMFLATHWPDIDRYEPRDGWPIPFLFQAIHILLYAGWVAMWWWLLRADRPRLRRSEIRWIAVGGLAYAGFDELTQTIVGRRAELGDLLVDAVGILLGIAVLSTWQRLEQRSPRRLSAS